MNSDNQVHSVSIMHGLVHTVVQITWFEKIFHSVFVQVAVVSGS